MTNQLEQLVAEWLEFTGYFVRRNIKVGPLSHGGHEGELDIVAYRHKDRRLLHIEPSMDSNTWEERERRYKKKFLAGRRYIKKPLFPWMPSNVKFEQWAILCASTTNHPKVGGGKVVPIWDLYEMIAEEVLAYGLESNAIISEQFPLLRTMFFALTSAWKLGDRDGLACAAHSRFKKKPTSKKDREKFSEWVTAKFLAQKQKEAKDLPDFLLRKWDTFGNGKRIEELRQKERP